MCNERCSRSRQLRSFGCCVKKRYELTIYVGVDGRPRTSCVCSFVRDGLTKVYTNPPILFDKRGSRETNTTDKCVHTANFGHATKREQRENRKQAMPIIIQQEKAAVAVIFVGLSPIKK